jgi:sugar phosphate isomerase/epimerase
MIPLGLDTYSLGAQNWTPFQLLEFAAKWPIQMVHFSGIRFLGSLDLAHLTRVRARADELAIELEIGMGSICPSSGTFDKSAGTAIDQIGRMVDAARIVRSPIIRAFVGNGADRQGGIERHIDETVQVLKRARSRLVDSGVRMAIENHAGDLQGRELKMLIEAAGSEFVGACIDSGNPVWTIEDPHLTLEVLAPYVLTSHIRDSALWRTPEGVAVRWTRMGEGNMGMEDYLRSYVRLCPGRAVTLEVIVNDEPRRIRYSDPEFWDAYRNQPAWEFARFLALCDRGTPPVESVVDPSGTPAARNLADVEASIAWTREVLEGM